MVVPVVTSTEPVEPERYRSPFIGSVIIELTDMLDHVSLARRLIVLPVKSSVPVSVLSSTASYDPSSINVTYSLSPIPVTNSQFVPERVPVDQATSQPVNTPSLSRTRTRVPVYPVGSEPLA